MRIAFKFWRTAAKRIRCEVGFEHRSFWIGFRPYIANVQAFVIEWRPNIWARFAVYACDKFYWWPRVRTGFFMIFWLGMAIEFNPLDYHETHPA